jgi:hypothetical protein
MPISLPGEDRLRPGAHRELVIALHELYSAAGSPSLRKVSKAINAIDTYDAALSHETIGRMLNGLTVPSWLAVRTIVQLLAKWGTPPSDPDEQAKRFLVLWNAAKSLPELTWEAKDMDRAAVKLTGPGPPQERDSHDAMENRNQPFGYCRHARFWKAFSEPSGQDLHIFTCGRDTVEDTVQRGVGGRTSVDKWDYQAAVDITHHFARHHRDIGVVIEQPVPKARIDERTRAFDTAEFAQRLISRNCIVIGSPDVSDFAEVTLARLLDVLPYAPQLPLNTGFRIRKAGRRFSTFYEQSSDNEPDGVRVIRNGESEDFFASSDDLDHGVMILADNPYTAEGRRRKILILAGHSGVATQAMSLLITNEERWCLDAFYQLDQKIAFPGGPIAAVIEVSYKRMRGCQGVGDDRVINTNLGSIRVCSVLPLEP